ncbi:MAG: DUF2231 domain-containing protein [Ferruginibacter sp.]
MNSKVKIYGHPIHPMLVSFPVAFYTAAFACFIAYNSNAEAFWFKVALVANIAGVVMAAVAAIPGFIDWLFIPKDTKPKKTGLLHMLCNVSALVLFGINWAMQCDKWNEATPSIGYAILLTGGGFLLTLVAGFLGWTMVQKHHVGVEPFIE